MRKTIYEDILQLFL